MVKISVLVPVYNEAATIIQVLDAINAQTVEGASFEIIVVDDGSRDGTAALLGDNAGLYSQLVTLERNGGKGAAVKAGLGRATGEYILFQDADLEYSPRDYARLLHPAIEFDADLVMGSRFGSPPYTRVHYFWHKIGNRVITLLFNLMNNTTFTDVYCGYLVYRRRLIDPEKLLTSGWEQQAEILTHAVAGARHMYEVPVGYRGRTYGEGKKIRPAHAFAVIWTIVKHRLMARRHPG